MAAISKRGATTMSARQFNQNTSGAKAAADRGPVYITDRGKPAYVLLSNAEYERLTGKPQSLLEALADRRPEAGFDYDFGRVSGQGRDPDFNG
jgi:prevent-host-death family protein